MIDFILNTKNNTINSTLMVFFDDNKKASLSDFKYDLLVLYNPKPSTWFFYHIQNYLDIISTYSNQYKNICLFGGSKGGSSAIILSNLLKENKIYENVFCWAMSPVLKITWGQTIKCNNYFISEEWEKIKNDESIKNIVDKYGNIISFINCSFPIMYSYSYNKDWTYDRDQYDLVKSIDCICEDFIENDKIANFNPKQEIYKNIHNTLGYYWKKDRDNFYSKLHNFVVTDT